MTEGAARQRSKEYKPQPKDELGEGTYASKQVTGEANIGKTLLCRKKPKEHFSKRKISLGKMVGDPTLV